jgi:quercetin dioxygenase-like cupin family protein
MNSETDVALPSQHAALLKSWAPVPGFHFGADECPWIPGEPGTWNKFMLFDLRKNSFATVFKMAPGVAIPPHYHVQAVAGYVLQGRWKYKEYDWVAGPGSFVYEPAGEVHTLQNGDETMVSFFHVTGPHITVDTEGRQIAYVDAFIARDYVRQYCESAGIDASFINRITV